MKIMIKVNSSYTPLERRFDNYCDWFNYIIEELKKSKIKQ